MRGLNIDVPKFPRLSPNTDLCTIHAFVALILIYPVSSTLPASALDYQSGFKVKAKRDPPEFTWSVCSTLRTLAVSTRHRQRARSNGRDVAAALESAADNWFAKKVVVQRSRSAPDCKGREPLSLSHLKSDVVLCLNGPFVVSSRSFYVQGLITFHNFQGLLSGLYPPVLVCEVVWACICSVFA